MRLVWCSHRERNKDTFIHTVLQIPRILPESLTYSPKMKSIPKPQCETKISVLCPVLFCEQRELVRERDTKWVQSHLWLTSFPGVGQGTGKPDVVFRMHGNLVKGNISLWVSPKFTFLIWERHSSQHRAGQKLKTATSCWTFLWRKSDLPRQQSLGNHLAWNEMMMNGSWFLSGDILYVKCNTLIMRLEIKL